jgi:hypothetical protein
MEKAKAFAQRRAVFSIRVHPWLKTVDVRSETSLPMASGALALHISLSAKVTYSHTMRGIASAQQSGLQSRSVIAFIAITD